MLSVSVLVQAVFVAVAAVIVLLYSGKGALVVRKLQELSYGKPGCAPVPDVGNVTLYYFAGRGRAEAIRLMLEEANITYTQVLYNAITWPEAKKEHTNHLFTFGQVPAIETTSGVRLVQSQAILHYLGRATGMECDCEDLHTCEVIALGVEDIRRKFGTLLYNQKFNLKDRDQYLTEVLPDWLGYMEALAPPLHKQEAAFFASGRLTWVDLMVFDLLESQVEFAAFDFTIPAASPDVLAAFPKLGHFYQRLAARPNVRRYRGSHQRLSFTIPYMPMEVEKTVKSNKA